VIIEFDPAAELIQGWLTQDGRPPTFFSGWLELASALERARPQHLPDSAYARPIDR